MWPGNHWYLDFIEGNLCGGIEWDGVKWVKNSVWWGLVGWYCGPLYKIKLQSLSQFLVLTQLLKSFSISEAAVKSLNNFHFQNIKLCLVSKINDNIHLPVKLCFFICSVTLASGNSTKGPSSVKSTTLPRLPLTSVFEKLINNITGHPRFKLRVFIANIPLALRPILVVSPLSSAWNWCISPWCCVKTKMNCDYLYQIQIVCHFENYRVPQVIGPYCKNQPAN